MAVDPPARAGGAISVLALATPEQVVLVEPAATPGLGDLLAAHDRPLGAYDAKLVHQALVRTARGAPARWACVHLSAVLLAGGREVDLSCEAIAAAHGLAPLPALDAGFAELAAHARALATLIERLGAALKTNEMTWVSKLEASAVAPIAEMEMCGMPFDRNLWRDVTGAVAGERASLAATIRGHLAQSHHDLFGAATVNLDSDAEIKAALKALGLTVPDARRETLAEMPAPLGPLLARYRELSKLASAYGEGFLEHVAADGRIHPQFEQIGASTGRLSCHRPNLQAVVKDAPHRACFRVPPHRRLVMADYAACELRILAEMSGDPVFADAFRHGEDLHARVAGEMFGKPVSKTQNPELRERAKAVNFGLAYGMGAAGLARAIATDVNQARDLLKRYFKTFPRIGGFLAESARQALERGYARTLTGRRLYLSASSDRTERAQAERIAKNMPIQGTSADIIKIALARLRRRLATFHDGWLVNSVHDAIVVECDTAQAEATAAAVREEMEAAGAEVLRHIPLVADLEVSATWDK